MTNEEKANEICKRHIFDSNHFDCCMEMAKWKDSQYQELKEATQTLYESARKVAQLYEPLQLALNNVFIELKLK